VLSRLEEAERRWYIGSLSSAPEAPTDAVLAQISGLWEKTIARGRRESEAGLMDQAQGRQRQPGGGRPKGEKKTTG
jgi:hypothetical protein